MNDAKSVILVVDDVPDTLTLASSLLSPQYKVKVATSGEAALEIARNDPPDLILLDVMMPGIDGITLIKTIRANDKYKRIAVIANTQYGDKKQEEDLRALGADDFLYKPTTPELVRLRPKYALAKYR